jgi:outer membrane protein TolC
MKRYAVMTMIALVGSLSVAAQTLILDRDAAVDLALENNRSLQLASIDLQGAARGADTAWNQLLPGLSASAGLTRNDRLLSDPMMPGQEGGSFSGSLDANIALQPGLVYSIRQTQLEFKAQEISYDQARRELVAQVESEFYYLVAARSDIEIQRVSLANARERYEQTRTDFERGRTSELSMLQAQVNAANQEPAYLSTVNSYNRRLHTFLMVLGVDPFTDVVLEGDLSVDRVSVDARELSDRYVQNRSDVRAQAATQEQLRNQKKLSAVSGRTPTLTLSAGWSTNVTDPFERTSWENEVWSDTATLSARLSIPLDGFIPGSTATVAIADAEDRINQGEIQLLETTDAARTEIINLVEQLDTAWANIELAHLNIELSRTAYEMSEEAYRRGTMALLDVADSEQEYLSAQQTYIKNQYEYLSGLIDLRLALGLDELPETGATDEDE